MSAPVRLIHRSKSFRHSLFWLGLAVFFGGAPLTFYLTSPGAPAANLVLATVLGLPLFGYSLYLLGHHTALVLRGDQTLLYITGVYGRRRIREISRDAVSSVCLAPGGDDGDSMGVRYWNLQLLLRSGERLNLDDATLLKARKLLFRVAASIGVPAREEGKDWVSTGSRH